MWDWSRQTWSQEPSFSKLSVAAGVTANELILIPSSPPHNQPAKERESHFTSCLKESGLCVFVLCAWGEFGCRCARICQPVCDGANLPALTVLDRRVVRKWHYPEGKRRGGGGEGFAAGISSHAYLRVEVSGTHRCPSAWYQDTVREFGCFFF